MADEKWSDFPAATSVADADITAVVQGGTNKQSALSVIKTYIQTAFDAIYAPLARTLNIGGTTQSLAANRTWTTNTILEGIGSVAQGDILYRGASAWARLPAGTSGNVLTTNGASANPTWTANATGDFSSNTSTSVDGEIVLFSGTGGKTGKRATGTGVAQVTSGVLSITTTSTVATLGSIELGAASDTTIARSSAGHISVEGIVVGLASNDLSFFTASTSNAIGVGTIELGNASDTTLSRSAGGVLAVEGVVVPTISSTNTFTNKRNTPRITSLSSNATPTINTDNTDCVTITALATAITSMTSNLSGTPNNFDKLIFRIKDDGTARAITWGSSFEAVGVALPTTTVISKRLTVGFIYDSVTSKWGCVASAQEA